MLEKQTSGIHLNKVVWMNWKSSNSEETGVLYINQLLKFRWEDSN